MFEGESDVRQHGNRVESSNAMDREILRKKAMYEGNACATAPVGYVGQGQPRNRRPIAARINDALEQAYVANQRANAAARAQELIQKHPEVAELLDLLNEF